MNCFESLRNTMVFSSQDWSVAPDFAWIYGIVVGWNDESFAELRKKFRWSESECNRLKQLHCDYEVVSHAFREQG